MPDDIDDWFVTDASADVSANEAAPPSPAMNGGESPIGVNYAVDTLDGLDLDDVNGDAEPVDDTRDVTNDRPRRTTRPKRKTTHRRKPEPEPEPEPERKPRPKRHKPKSSPKGGGFDAEPQPEPELKPDSKSEQDPPGIPASPAPEPEEPEKPANDPEFTNDEDFGFDDADDADDAGETDDGLDDLLSGNDGTPDPIQAAADKLSSVASAAAPRAETAAKALGERLHGLAESVQRRSEQTAADRREQMRKPSGPDMTARAPETATDEFDAHGIAIEADDENDDEERTFVSSADKHERIRGATWQIAATALIAMSAFVIAAMPQLSLLAAAFSLAALKLNEMATVSEGERPINPIVRWAAILMLGLALAVTLTSGIETLTGGATESTTMPETGFPSISAADNEPTFL